MITLRSFIQKQIDNIDKLNNDTKLMIIDKTSLETIAILSKENMTSALNDLSSEYLDKGVESGSQNRSLGCGIIVITDIPDSQRPMFV